MAVNFFKWMENFLGYFEKDGVLGFHRRFEHVAESCERSFQSFLRLFPQAKCYCWRGMAEDGLKDQS